MVKLILITLVPMTTKRFESLFFLGLWRGEKKKKQTCINNRFLINANKKKMSGVNFNSHTSGLKILFTVSHISCTHYF